MTGAPYRMNVCEVCRQPVTPDSPATPLSLVTFRYKSACKAIIGSIEHHPYLTFAPFLIFRFLAPRPSDLISG